MKISWIWAIWAIRVHKNFANSRAFQQWFRIENRTIFKEITPIFVMLVWTKEYDHFMFYSIQPVNKYDIGAWQQIKTPL